MGLKKLFKRRSRDQVGKSLDTASHTSSNKFNTTEHTVSSHCDGSTASESSNNAKAVLLESHARNGKWDAVLKVARESELDDWNGATTSTTNNSESSFHSLHEATTPLHLALAHRAPLNVVDALIVLLREKFQVPVPEESQDEYGRTPLHVAVTAGCDKETVERLLAGDGLLMPAVLKDAQGQTPLHATCGSPLNVPKKKNMFAANPEAMFKWHKRCVMELLLEEYPEALAVKDAQGRTPVDCAHEMGYKDSVVKKMERLTADYLADLAPRPPLDASPEICPSLQHADVPFIVPSATGSCRDFALASCMKLEDVLDDGIKDTASDVSTIGDSEPFILEDDF